ncbi:MAG: FtsQ-type POTRA domain-containing protein [Gammaproteobacteria bacterium]|nr:FtsQ-type POTRA domain-containing protein [Gammaproteobacteria bacterium]
MWPKMSGAQARPRSTAAPISFKSVVSIALSLVALVALGYFAQSAYRSVTYPIRKVMVEGDFRILTPTYIQSAVTDALDGGFFEIDVQKIKRRMLEEPWVAEVVVERVWPDAVRVTIKEQVPAATWGRHALLNGEADIFAPAAASIPSGLPRLDGPVGTESTVLAMYRTVAKRLTDLELKPVAVVLSQRGAWVVELADGAQLVLGRASLDERIARFTVAYAALLKSNWSHIGVVDLRYTNGFAVRERSTIPNIGEGSKQRG